MISPTLIAAGVGLAVVATVVGVSRYQVSEAREDLANCQQTVRELQLSVGRQNDRIDEFKGRAAAAQAAASAAQAQAASAAASGAAEVRRLRRAAPSSCDAAAAAVREGLGS